MIVSTAMRTDEQIHYDAMLSAYGKVCLPMAICGPSPGANSPTESANFLAA